MHFVFIMAIVIIVIAIFSYICLRLLKAMGFPEEIVEEAERRCKQE